MPQFTRHAVAALLALLLAQHLGADEPPKAPAGGEKVNLTSNVQVGDQWQVAIGMRLQGQRVFKTNDKGGTPIAIEAQAEHRLDERVLKAADGLPNQVGRHYHLAKASFQHHTAKGESALRAERRFIAAQRMSVGTVVYSPNGPLTRPELDLCRHVDVLAMHGILPGKEVTPGTSWEVDLLTAQALAHLDGVTTNKLTARLEKCENQVATLLLTGLVEGIKNGGEAKVEFNGKIEYHVGEKHFVQAEWRQSEKHAPTPVLSDAAVNFELAARIIWSYPGASAELLDALVAQVPAEPTPAHLLLQFRDAKDRFSFTHERCWHVAANSPEQVVLRCLERGELLAQVNLRPWKSARPGEHLDPKELEEQVKQAPGFTVEQIADKSELPTNPGCWLFRIALMGKVGELSLVQTTYALAGPKGDQLIATFTCETEQAVKFGTRDLTLVKAIEFPAVVQTGGK